MTEIYLHIDARMDDYMSTRTLPKFGWVPCLIQAPGNGFFPENHVTDTNGLRPRHTQMDNCAHLSRQYRNRRGRGEVPLRIVWR